MRIGTVLCNDSVYNESPVKYTIYVGRSGKGRYYNVIFPHKGHVCYTRFEKECVGFGKHIHPVGKTDILRKIVQTIESELSNYKENVANKNDVDKYVNMTNAGRIRNMTNEELASFLDKVESSGYNCGGVLDSFSDFDDGCYSTLEWLNHEVSNNFKEWLESECDTE